MEVKFVQRVKTQPQNQIRIETLQDSSSNVSQIGVDVKYKINNQHEQQQQTRANKSI